MILWNRKVDCIQQNNYGTSAQEIPSKEVQRWKRKMPDGFCTFKDKGMNYMKGKVYKAVKEYI